MAVHVDEGLDNFTRAGPVQRGATHLHVLFVEAVGVALEVVAHVTGLDVVVGDARGFVDVGAGEEEGTDAVGFIGLACKVERRIAVFVAGVEAVWRGSLS